MPELRGPARLYLEDRALGGALVPLAGDASSRRFFRIRTPDGTSRIAMVYPEAFEGSTDDVRLERIFCEAGLRVARVLEVSGEAGCILLEDLGDVSLESAVACAREREAYALLERAVRLAAGIANRGTPVLAGSDRAGGPALDAARFRFEMDFYLEHYVAALRGCTPPPELAEALHALADAATDSSFPVLCHRDFHSRNIHVLPDGTLAMVDIQDARWGPDAYDSASLLRDAYGDVPEAWIDPLLLVYCRTRESAPDAVLFRRRFDVVGAQRMIKALGTFGYQTAVLGSRRYQDAMRRTIERLDRVLPVCTETRALHGLLKRSGLLAP